MDSKGRQIHGQAAQARENGDFLKALELTDQAMLAYQKEDDKLGMAEILADRSISFRHLNAQTNDKSFLYLAKAEMVAAVKIAKDSGNKEALALPLFNLAQSEEDLGEYTDSIRDYKEAINNTFITPGVNKPNPNSPAHNRPAELANMKSHLHHAEYKSGDKSALERMVQVLKELEEAPEVDSYNKDTWLSGGYMRTAEMLREDNPQIAKEYLQKAKIVIDANPKLKIRREQWEKLAEMIA
jgi:tetratricopeptide (TPR) repeat protein